MTRRERLEAKLDKRHEWAGKAETRAASRFATADRISERFAEGQPIICNHHSEAGARADQRRIHSNMDKGMEESALARHHEQAAAGIGRMLAHDIFSDDDNAIEALQARIDQHEATAARWVEVNKAWRKSKGEPAAFALLAGISETDAIEVARKVETAYSWEKQPIASYQLTNLRARIRTDKERIQQIKTHQARTEQAEAAGGITVEPGPSDSCRITFAKKPSRDVLDSLKAASYMWSGGSWYGYHSKLPAGIP